jgi:hypothetical protein
MEKENAGCSAERRFESTNRRIWCRFCFVLARFFRYLVPTQVSLNCKSMWKNSRYRHHRAHPTQQVRPLLKADLVFSMSEWASIALVTGGVAPAAIRSITSSSGSSSRRIGVSGSRTCRISAGRFATSGSGGRGMACPQAILVQCPSPGSGISSLRHTLARATSETLYSPASLRSGNCQTLS